MIAAAERIIPAALADADERALHWTRYETAVPFAAGRRVLDMACGVGYGTARLAATAETALGADVSVAAVAEARVMYRETGARFTVADATRLPFESDSFDLVVSFETLEHLEAPEAAVREFARVLAPGGRAIVSVPNGPLDRLTGNPFHRQFFTLEDFRRLLGGSFTVESIGGVSPAPRHPGLAAIEVPAWVKRTVPSSLRDRLNAFRRAKGRVSAGAEAAAAPCWIAQCTKR